MADQESTTVKGINKLVVHCMNTSFERYLGTAGLVTTTICKDLVRHFAEILVITRKLYTYSIPCRVRCSLNPNALFRLLRTVCCTNATTKHHIGEHWIVQNTHGTQKLLRPIYLRRELKLRAIAGKARRLASLPLTCSPCLTKRLYSVPRSVTGGC